MAYMGSNWWSMRENTSAIAVELEIMHTARCTLANSWRLVVDAALETSWAPVHKLDSSLGLNRGYGGIHVLGNNVTTVHHTARHVLSVTRIALGHHRSRLERRVGDLGDRKLLVVRLLSGDDRCVRRKHEVDAWV